jgi:hypothetical protein
MGKRFVPVGNVDKRAIRLYRMLREVEGMPLVTLHVNEEPKVLIILGAKDDHTLQKSFTVDQFLLLNIEQAKANGGTAQALWISRAAPTSPRIPQKEVDGAVVDFLSPEDDE